MKFEYNELSISDLGQYVMDNIKANGKWVNDLYYRNYWDDELKQSSLGLEALFTNVVRYNTKYFIKVEIEETYKVGDRFEFGVGVVKEMFILAQAEHGKVTLISLTDGNRWAPNKSVKNVKCITKEEFDNITDDKSHQFKKLDKVKE